MPGPWAAHVAAASVVLLISGGWFVLDPDFDGARTSSELAQGLQPWNGDSDGDLLADGWELQAGFDAGRVDPDQDGLTDWQEIQARSNPLAADTDLDGLADGAEPAQDCDADGLFAAGDGDDDDDGRLDPLEPISQRCNTDFDRDGVLDGAEGARVCVGRRDCDGDGLVDGQEGPAQFNPLDADTFDVGLPDSVSWAFAQQGQPPGGDADSDGIPDPWEGSDGAITWGDLTPSASRRDLLIEYLRIEGPQSGRFNLDLSPAYRAVEDTFQAQANIHVVWTETRITLASEQVPPIVPSISDDYYQFALLQGRHSTNPFVTTVVLNPQHDQSLVAHAGIAPIRGMVAAVDFGQSVVFSFSNLNGSSLTITPLFEELITAFAREPTTSSQTLLLDAGYDSAGVGPGTRVNLHRPSSGSSSGYTLSWQPTWFSSPIAVAFDLGPKTNLTLDRVRVDQAGLAGTILHELGHTLGLCHSHDIDCATLDEVDRARQHLSTMSYDSAQGTLRFLPSEWTTVRAYLTCPPVEPVTLLSQSASADGILAAKYDVPEDTASVADDRACNEFLELPQEFVAGVPAAQTFVTPASYAEAYGGESHLLLAVGLALGTIGLAAVVDVLLWRRLRPQAPTLWQP